MKNWKNDDELLNLAFGELDSHSSQKLEAQLLNDVEAQRELNLLKMLRSDMTALNDIPEMQFSKERLREAILSQGVKPAKPAFPWLNWLLAPTALAAVAALAFVMTKGVNHRDPVIVASKWPSAVEQVIPNVGLNTDRVATTKSNSDPGDTFPDVADTHWAYEKDGKASQVPPPPQYDVSAGRNRGGNWVIPKSKYNNMLASTVRRLPKSKRRHSFGKSNPTVLVASNRITHDSASEALTSTGSTAPAAIATITADASPRVEETPIIMISSSIDSGAGAPTATEVSNPSNVLIGG